jgi:hypothetical protein
MAQIRLVTVAVLWSDAYADITKSLQDTALYTSTVFSSKQFNIVGLSKQVWKTVHNTSPRNAQIFIFVQLWYIKKNDTRTSFDPYGVIIGEYVYQISYLMFYTKSFDLDFRMMMMTMMLHWSKRVGVLFFIKVTVNIKNCQFVGELL